MLAFLGFIVQEFVRLPGDLYSEPNGVKAFFQVCSVVTSFHTIWLCRTARAHTHTPSVIPQQVGPQPLIQILLFCGFLEFNLHKGKMTQVDMFADGTREPGAFMNASMRPPFSSPP